VKNKPSVSFLEQYDKWLEEKSNTKNKEKEAKL